MLKKKLIISSKITLSPQKNNCVVIAEIAGAHQGELAIAKKLLDATKQSGADFAKFQAFTATGLLSKYHDRFEHFKKIQFSKEDWQNIIQYATDLKIPLIFDVFDEDSFTFLETKPGILGYKLHSSDLNNDRLLKMVGSSNKIIFLGVGGSSLYEIQQAIDILSPQTTKIILMPGFQAFPTKLEDLNLNQISFLAKRFPYFTGYADHVDAATPYGLFVPQMAAVMGAKVIEKHLTLSRKEKGIDYYSALEPEEFQSMVTAIKNIQVIKGHTQPTLQTAEITYRKKMKKCLVATGNIPKNTLINSKHLNYKRANEGLAILEKNKILNRKLIVDKKEDEPFCLNDFNYPAIICIAVRMHSTRLTGKALLKIQGKETIRHLIDRAKQAKIPNQVVLCTSTHPDDQVLIQIAKEENIGYIAGSEKDVMARFIQAAEIYKADIVVRITGDDILTDPVILDDMICFFKKSNADYVWAEGLPKGVESEIIAVEALKRAHKLAEDPEWTEYMTWYLKNPDYFHIEKYPLPSNYYHPEIRLTLDHKEDFEVIKILYEHLYNQNPLFSTKDIIDFFKKNPTLLKMNQNKKARTKVKGLNTKLKLKY